MLDVVDGTEQWSFEPEDSMGTIGIGPPAVLGDTVYIGGQDKTASSWVSSVVVVDGTLYAGTTDGAVHALTAE